MGVLDKARAEIDKIDREMLRLFERRMAAAGEVAEYKRTKGLPVLDSAREKVVLEKNMARLKNRELAGYYASYLSNLMFLSRRYQARLLGTTALAHRDDEAALARAVADAVYPGCDLMPTATLRDVFEAVQAGDAAMGLVPVEGNGAGLPDAVLDLCYTHSCAIKEVVDVYPQGQEEPVRCLVLAQKPAQSGNHVALLVTVGNHVGKLARAIEALADEGLVMETVKSRKAPDETGEYYYYLQMLCAPEGLFGDALQARLAETCGWCRVLGVYSIQAVGGEWAEMAAGG